MKNWKRIMAGSLSLSMLLSIGGCGKKELGNAGVEFDEKSLIDWNQYEDTSDIPAWEGNNLDLIVWSNASSPNSNNIGKTPTNDVVRPEIERVTGISFNEEESFDNGGQSFDVRIGKMLAAKQFPHVGVGIGNIEGLVKNDYLWRLDEYILKYCPNLVKFFGPDTIFGKGWNRQMELHGGVYSIPINFNTPLIRAMVNEDQAFDLTTEQVALLAGTDNSMYGHFLIRDDILKKIYPEAKNAKEFEELYVAQNGEYTQEQLMDVPLESPDDFIDLLYKIKDLGLKEGERDIMPFYTHSGGDNWPLLVGLGNMMGYCGDWQDANYFTYWDKETGKIEYAFQQDWFKDLIKTYNQLIRDGVASAEALLDTDGTFKEKLNSGYYATSYYFNTPDEKLMESRPYKYRKVFAKYPINEDKFMWVELDPSAGTLHWSVFKTMVSESQLIQILRMMDYMVSKPGRKLTVWGPKSAGLYGQREDGSYYYTDPELVDMMENGVKNDADLKYGLNNRQWPEYPAMPVSEYSAKLFAPGKIVPKKALGNMTMGKIAPVKRTQAITPSIFKFTDYLPEVKRFWNARNSFEDALTKVFTAENDEQFEKLYKDMVDLAERNGLTEQTLEDINKEYETNINRDYMDNLR